MLEEKILGILKKGALAITAAAMILGCDSNQCAAPIERYVPKAEIMRTSSYNIIGEIEHAYVLAECPSGCTYDSGCCYCPE